MFVEDMRYNQDREKEKREQEYLAQFKGSIGAELRRKRMRECLEGACFYK